ncbi:MAG: hypothetical protein K2H41_12025 [Acetatifactor sp.]|nr:hypothetical protein [Acetatifactor sp.]
MDAILLTMIMMGFVIIVIPPVNLLTAMEMVFVTITALTSAEKVRETVPASEEGVVAGKADVADNTMPNSDVKKEYMLFPL